ncbi:heme/hemin ABC transporter substrate-binding protein [Labrys monachus]|uniref:Iron complex transport system substrate-binding protein n=1 Tax=Labrys monachus TaxID=217067 RepID=A0ABU0FBV5_9HYPH|nr:ABC transporter substrate-binding protein [Labrys monachus]MDQ0391578.1 iron complex transport system substrate-binding protein [Labrys monachus]
MPLSRLDRRQVLLATALALLAAPGRGLAQPVQRIVCAGADVTEIVAALAGAAAIQGVDTTSHMPPEVRNLPSIGYLRQISAEGILSLEPDIVIANRDLGPPAAVAQLRKAGVRIELVDFPPSGEGMAAKIRHVGTLLGRDAQAAVLAGTTAAAMADLARRLDGVAMRPRIGFIRSIDGGTPIAGGKMGLVDAAYALAGGTNAFAGFSLFKPVSREVLAASPPDFIVADVQAVAALGGSGSFIDALGLIAAFAGRHERLIDTDLTILFGFAPSSAAAITMLARRLHPERFVG